MGSRLGHPKQLEAVVESCRDGLRKYRLEFVGRVERVANVGRAEEGFGSIASSANQPGSRPHRRPSAPDNRHDSLQSVGDVISGEEHVLLVLQRPYDPE